jgi:hypothetical protein
MTDRKAALLEKAGKALKRHSRRSNAAKALDLHTFDVILAGGCLNKLEQMTTALNERYAKRKS